MVITREMLVKLLADKSGYYQQNVRHVLKCLDEVVYECMDEVGNEDEISIQLVEGVKLCCKIMEPRNGFDPMTKQMTVRKPAPKVFAKISENFKTIVRDKYKEREDS